MNETGITTEPTVGGLLRGAFTRISTEIQVFGVLVALYAIANILLYLPLLEPLQAVRAAADTGDPAAIQEAGRRLLGPFFMFIGGGIVAFGFFAALWGPIAAFVGTDTRKDLLARTLKIVWRVLAFIGWAILLGVPLFLFLILVQAVLGLVGLDMQAATGKLVMQALLAIVAIVLYLPLSAAFQLAVIETAATDRTTPINVAFQAMLRRGTSYLIAFFLVVLVFGGVGFVWDQVFSDGGVPTRVSLIGSAAFNSLTSGVLLALAAEMRDHVNFRRPEVI